MKTQLRGTLECSIIVIEANILKVTNVGIEGGIVASDGGLKG